MAVTSKDIEILWERFTSEGVSKGISVHQYFPDFVNAYPKIHQQTMEQCVDAVS